MLVTQTAAGATMRLAIQLLGKLRDDGVSRMLLLRVATAGPLGGSAFLTVERQAAPHDVWIYLPALGTPRRLLSSNFADSFLGSEFRVGDLLQADPDDYAVSVRGTDRHGDELCWIVDALPRDATVERRAGLGKQTLWLGRADGLERRIDQYDRSGNLLKVVELGGWTGVVGGRKWLALERRIRNVQSGASSAIVFEHAEAGVGVAADAFTPQHLADRSW
jgi:hypothetical protein